ncbi:hypothetical protein LOTGIDRAFT_249376 [Lottia gigantea]|uniref:Uncharacterized protein n=1 Tax=Lottia gigantea TaxID=225164 RepID=V4AIX2_LOTGI|nr:hypothetical protein LOTGIDRAFT_249376 [Lottia gigantea]ESP04079.1 hypothetical protein LOTGIDRAFT_249376 [Lottia gigantea]
MPKRKSIKGRKRSINRCRSGVVAFGAAANYRGSFDLKIRNPSQRLALKANLRLQSAAIGVRRGRKVAMLGGYRLNWSYSIAYQKKRAFVIASYHKKMHPTNKMVRKSTGGTKSVCKRKSAPRMGFIAIRENVRSKKSADVRIKKSSCAAPRKRVAKTPRKKVVTKAPRKRVSSTKPRRCRSSLSAAMKRDSGFQRETVVLMSL